MARLELTVNGKARSVEIDAGESLLSVLRDALDLTGAKYGCGEGQCGACTVLLGDQTVRSCVVPVRTVEGKPIYTIEFLSMDHAPLESLQEAFVQEDAMQCGYCTTGMIMSAFALLARNPNPTEEQIVQGMNGNVCRCGSHPRIIAAIQRAAAARRNRA